MTVVKRLLDLNDKFDFNKLNRPATKKDWGSNSPVAPCVGHDKQSEIEEQVDRLKHINDVILNREIEKKATKFDEGKPSYTSIPQLALKEVARGFTLGKAKYGQYNYSGQMEVTRYLDALNRHMSAYLTGESIDSESQVHHLALVACNALMALDGIYTGNTIENLNSTYKQINEQTTKTNI